jgi:VanZ family protein
MADSWDQDRRPNPMLRGLGWCACVMLWTAALLTTTPVRVGEAVTPAVLHFSAAKGLHISVYAFLTMYAAWLSVGRWRWLLLAFLSLHAAATEYLQQYVPGRHGMLSDVLIDHFGLALGVALTWKRWTAGRVCRYTHKATPVMTRKTLV